MTQIRDDGAKRKASLAKAQSRQGRESGGLCFVGFAKSFDEANQSGNDEF
jgi:hypothetical protein